MAHFAQLNSKNVVISVIVVDNKNLLDENNQEQESIGIQYCQNLFGSYTNWKQTSYSSNIRKNYAGIGMFYHEQYDAFLRQSPYDSWILNEETLEWEAPIPKPELTEEEIQQRKEYIWNDGDQTWTLIELS
jgi:hypothetical protein